MFNQLLNQNSMIMNMLNTVISKISKMINSNRILLWNSNGLVQRRNELKLFLSEQKIDIALISESPFTDLTYFNIPNYQLYKTNHPRGNGHGGSAIFIKNSIPHHENLTIPTKYKQPA